MKTRKALLVVVLAAAMAMLVAVAAAQTFNSTSSHPAVATSKAAVTTSAQAARQLHELRGTVTSVRRGHWFSMHTTSGQSVRIYTSTGTHWQGCDWGDMHAGYHMDVHVYRSHGEWMAARMQAWHDDQGGHHGSNGDDHGPGMMDGSHDPDDSGGYGPGMMF